jgi:hypothetical protein
MKKIDTYEGLQRERKRLHERQRVLEKTIKKDLQEIKIETDHNDSATNVMQKIIDFRKDKVITGTGIFSEVLTRGILFRKSGFFTKLIAGIITRQIAEKIMEEKESDIASWVKKLFEKITDKKKKKLLKHKK